MTRNAAIVGVGSYLPERVLTNSDFEQIVETSDEWIVSRTGIRERRMVADGEASSDLGARAARRALETAGIDPDEVDLIVVGTGTPDHIFPATACLVQAKLGMSCPAYDVQAACSGFMFALSSGAAAIESGRADTVLVIGAEALTRVLDFEDRATCVLFGDGAGAVVLRVADEPGVDSIVLGTDGRGADLISIPAGGSAMPCTPEVLDARDQYLHMSGNEVFKFAVRVIPKATHEALEASGHRVDELTWLVPHQANQRILDTIADRLGLSHDRVFSNVEKVGNTSAASIPLALDDLYTSGRLRPGDLLALVGFGAGLTWGAAIVRWTMAGPNKED